MPDWALRRGRERRYCGVALRARAALGCRARVRAAAGLLECVWARLICFMCLRLLCDSLCVFVAAAASSAAGPVVRRSPPAVSIIREVVTDRLVRVPQYKYKIYLWRSPCRLLWECVRVFSCVPTASGRTAPVTPTGAGVGERVDDNVCWSVEPRANPVQFKFLYGCAPTLVPGRDVQTHKNLFCRVT